MAWPTSNFALANDSNPQAGHLEAASNVDITGAGVLEVKLSGDPPCQGGLRAGKLYEDVWAPLAIVDVTAYACIILDSCTPPSGGLPLHHPCRQR